MAKARGKQRAGPGRPPRPGTRERKQIVVDVALLARAMRVTGLNQSETVNQALAQVAENAAIVAGLEELRGAFPDHPDHSTR
jgi:Arc/MetJ family transcription regulator